MDSRGRGFGYWEEFMECRGEFNLRWEGIREYAFAVPDPKAISVIAKYSPIVEIGAGTGYWARLLSQAGADIVAYDIQPPYGYLAPWLGEEDNFHKFKRLYYPVFHGGVEKAVEHSDRALFLCWPPYAEPMAYAALQAYRGNIVIYIGEGYGGCTGDDAFHDELTSEEWVHMETYDLSCWDGIHDALEIYRRRRSCE